MNTFVLNYNKYWTKGLTVKFVFNKTFKKLSLTFHTLKFIKEQRWNSTAEHKIFFLTFFDKELNLFCSNNTGLNFNFFNLKYNVIQTLYNLYLFLFDILIKSKSLILPAVASFQNYFEIDNYFFSFDHFNFFNKIDVFKNDIYFPTSFLKTKNVFHKFVFLQKTKKVKSINFQKLKKVTAVDKNITNSTSAAILKINFFNSTVVCTNNFRKQIFNSVVLLLRTVNFFDGVNDSKNCKTNLALGKIFSSGTIFFKKQYVNCLIIKCLPNKLTWSFFLNTFRGFSFLFVDKHKIIKSLHCFKPFLFLESGLILDVFRRLHIVKIFGILNAKLFDNIKIILPFHNFKQFVTGTIIYVNTIGLVYVYIPLFFDLIYCGVVVTLCDGAFTKYIISSFQRAALKNLNFFFYKDLIVPRAYKYLYVHFNKLRKF